MVVDLSSFVELRQIESSVLAFVNELIDSVLVNVVNVLEKRGIVELRIGSGSSASDLGSNAWGVGMGVGVGSTHSATREGEEICLVVQ